ncbi:hypothetical protein ACFLTI_06160 [Bacteroidota bacterium]
MTTAGMSQKDPMLSKPIHEIGFGLALVNPQMRDAIVSPLKWDGFGGGLDFTYARIGLKGIHEIAMRNSFGPISNRYGHEGLNAEVSLAYAYMKRINGTELGGKLQLGSMIDWSYNFQLYESWDDSHLYWINAYELGPVVRWSNILGNNHQIALNFNLPLLALVSRPPKNKYIDQDRLPKTLLSQPHENMKLTSIHQYISFRLRAEYTVQLSRKTSFGISYLLNYKSFSKPERIVMLTNTLQVCLKFKIGNL